MFLILSNELAVVVVVWSFTLNYYVVPVIVIIWLTDEVRFGSSLDVKSHVVSSLLCSCSKSHVNRIFLVCSCHFVSVSPSFVLNFEVQMAMAYMSLLRWNCWKVLKACFCPLFSVLLRCSCCQVNNVVVLLIMLCGIWFQSFKMMHLTTSWLKTSSLMRVLVFA